MKSQDGAEQERTAVDLPGAPLENPLSEREMEVGRLLVTGASNAEIARDLVISPHTVKVHLRNIFEKLQVNSRTEASMLLVQRGWITVPGVELPTLDPALFEPPPPPEPEPLADRPAPVALWQALLLVAALALSLLLVLLPNVVSMARSPANLMTDAGNATSGPASIRLEPRWEIRTPLQSARSRLAATALNNRVYVLGGEDASGTTLSEVAVYDLATNEWAQAPALPVALSNLAATSADGKIYVAGGSTAESGSEPALVDTLYAFDPESNQWAERARLPYAVAGAALVADADALYLIGGWDGREMRDEIWRFPFGALPLAPPPSTPDATATAPGASAWQLVGHLSKARAFLGAVPVGGEIYIAGGYDGQRDLDLAEVFTPANGERRQLPSLGTARGGLALVYDGLAVYALGGGWTRPISTHERFDTASNTWSNFPSPLQGEWRNLGAVATDGRIHLLGGWSGAPLDTHLEYQSSFRALLPVISND